MKPVTCARSNSISNVSQEEFELDHQRRPLMGAVHLTCGRFIVHQVEQRLGMAGLIHGRQAEGGSVMFQLTRLRVTRLPED